MKRATCSICGLTPGEGNTGEDEAITGHYDGDDWHCGACAEHCPCQE